MDMSPEELDATLEQLYHSAKSASSEGLQDEALQRCEQAYDLLESYGEDTERYSYFDFAMLEGDIYWAAGDWEQAYQAYYKVYLNDPERHDARVATGVALFHLCRFAAAQSILEMSSLDDPEDPEVWYYLGLLALRREERKVALKYFEYAHEIDEERYFVPVDITEEEIMAMVERMIEDIPGPMRKALDNVPIILEKRPEEELLISSDPPMDPTLLGLFDGIPLTELDSTSVVPAPTRIILFTENIWLLSHDRAVLEEELFITLKHEIGHFFGLSEEELTQRGLD